METIGNRIKRLRRKKGMTQMRLAAEIGVTQTTVFYWESGVHKPYPLSMIKLARALDVPCRELMYGEGTENELA